MSKVSSIAKNTSYFTFALILQKVISFAYFTILARNLIPEELGKYYFAVSFTTIFSVFIDLGLTNVLIRETAKAKERARELLGTVLAIKIPLAIGTMAVLLVLINLMGYPALTRDLVYLSSISMILDSFTLIFFAVIRGHHNLKYESIASIVFQIIIMTLGVTFLKMGLGLRYLMLSLVTASIFNFCYSFLLVRFKWKIKITPIYNSALIRSLVFFAIPFAAYGILQRLYMYFDTVLLSYLSGDYYVGLYQIAFKIIFALQFLPMAFIASLYPAFASYWKDMNTGNGTSDQQPSNSALSGATHTPSASQPPLSRGESSASTPQLVITFERALNYLIIISLPISIGVITLADKIMLLFKPEYIDAILPLQLIMASLLFMFINFPIGSLLNACDRQKINSLNMGITLAASLILNIFLIPFFQKNYGNGAIGASITVILSNILMFCLGILRVPAIISVRPMKIISTFLKVLVSVIIMGAIVLAAKAYMSIFLVVPLGGLVYFISLLLFGGFRKEDLMSIYSSFMKKV